MNIEKLLCCPVCRSPLTEALRCETCGVQYEHRHGVYRVISPVLSEDAVIYWKIKEEMLEDPEAFLKQEEQEEAWTKDYFARKNKETIVAEKKLNEYTDSLLKTISGTVCDLATGMGGMLRKLLDAGSETRIVCTDIDPNILAWTRVVQKTDDARVAYVATDGRFLSFRDESFDYVTSLAGFGNIPESDKVAKEIYRVLKKSGKMIIQGQYIEPGSKSYEIAKTLHLEQGLVEESLIACLRAAGFTHVDSIVVDEAVWAENPYDLIPATGDTQRFCCIIAEK